MSNLVAIYVETQYQLITALNIAKNSLNADGCFLFIMEQLYLTDRKFQVSSDHSYIKGIYYIQDYNEVGAFKHHLLRVRGILTGHPSKDYPNMLCFYKTRPLIMPKFDSIICNKYEVKLARQYNNLYRKTDVYVIEDGTGDYVTPPIDIPTEYRRIYYWNDFFTSIFGFPAEKVPTISLRDTQLKRIYQSIFPVSEDKIAKFNQYRCIYFHQPFDIVDEDQEYTDSYINQEAEVLKLLYEKYKDNFVIKLHPRDNLNTYAEYPRMTIDIPWEMLLFHMENIENVVVVGFHSTALLTAKMVFDKEPVVISLIEMIQIWKRKSKDETTNNIGKLFNTLKVKYRDNERVQIPNGIDELKDFLECVDL